MILVQQGGVYGFVQIWCGFFVHNSRSKRCTARIRILGNAATRCSPCAHSYQPTSDGTGFREDLSDFELRQWFTFGVRERRVIRKEFRSRHWIGVALQSGFVAMTGTTLRSLEYVPAILLRHLGRQFVQKAPDLATLRTLYRRSQTLYEHQRWAIEFMGLRKFDENAEKRLSVYIGERTEASLTRNRLEQMGHEWLFQSYSEMPGIRSYPATSTRRSRWTRSARLRSSGAWPR